MGDILNIGTSALLTYQRTLSTVSHNIANANNENYSRQVVDLASRPGQEFGFGFLGNGVEQLSVRRRHDTYLEGQIQSLTSQQSRSAIFAQLSSQINNLFADEVGNLNSGLQSFFSSLQDVANDPASISSREVFLSEGVGLVERFNSLESSILQARNDLNNRIGAIVDEVNALAQGIADINNQIFQVSDGDPFKQPNDLLDERDALIRQLSQFVSVQTAEENNGVKNVFFGNGQVLVFGINANQLTTIQNPEDFSEFNIAFLRTGGVTQDVTRVISGGELGGILDYRENIMDQSSRDLGRIAVILSDTFNAQHRDGMDLNGALGADFFTQPAPLVIQNLNNTGTAAVTATITNSAVLTASDYRLSYDGATYTLTRLSDNASVSGAGPLVMDGVTVTIGAGALAGDQFLVRPSYAAGSRIDLNISSMDQIAAAAPVRASSLISNLGSAEINYDQILNVADADLLDTVEIVFNNPPTDFDVVNITDATTIAAGVAYTPGANIDFNGIRVNVTGVPEAGDTFRVESNAGGVNDNRNSLLLAALQNQNLIGGTASYEQAYSSSVASVGSQINQAEISSDAQATLLSQLQTARDAISGVNLDEEAADLLRYQQAYQAAAQLINVSNELFQTLLGAVRR